MNWLTNMIGLFIIAMLLTGYISIPTGDGGTIKLSKDGVEVKRWRRSQGQRRWKINNYYG